MKLRITISIASLAIVLAGGLIRQPSSGQQQFPTTNRKPACGCYACGLLLAVDFPNKAKDCYGILATDACPEELAKMPDKGKAYCKVVRARSKDGSLNGCETLAKYCDSLEQPSKDEPPEKDTSKCKEREKDDPPWFDPSAPGCQYLQDTRMDANWFPANGGTCVLTLTACNRTVLRLRIAPDETNVNPEGMKTTTRSECTPQLYEKLFGDHPSTVCCDIFQEGVRAGSGCNPETDADCDGLPNERDNYLNARPYYAPPRPGFEEDFYKPAPGDFNPANFDPRPPGLTWDEVMPNEPCKKCKWMALSGNLTCSPDGRKEHEYKVTWVCPSSGVQRVITKRAPASAPCTPPSAQRSAG